MCVIQMTVRMLKKFPVSTKRETVILIGSNHAVCCYVCYWCALLRVLLVCVVTGAIEVRCYVCYWCALLLRVLLVCVVTGATGVHCYGCYWRALLRVLLVCCHVCYWCALSRVLLVCI
jgi:hypothetical protein